MSWITKAGWQGHLIALLAGAITPLFLAPFNIWILAPVSIGLFYLGLQHITPMQALLRGWCYGFGAYITGVSWIYVSINTFGNASMLLAGFLTIAFCMCIAWFLVIPAFLWAKWFRSTRTIFIDALAFAGLWMLQEWFRGWFLTGFPWLYTGYSQLDGPLAGFAPIGGVWFISFLLAFWTVLCCKLYTLKKQQHTVKLTINIALLVIIPVAGLLFGKINWTTPIDEPLPVTMIQGNVEQSMKWDAKHFEDQLMLYSNLSQSNQLKNSLVIWPENAVPYLKEHVENYLQGLSAFEKNNNSALITGIPIRRVDNFGDAYYYNGITVIGEGEGTYLKQRLVPFGEYVPLEETLRGVIAFFDLPMSNFRRGPDDQLPLQAKGYLIAPFICYEVVYPDFTAILAAKSHFLLTISNDTWFGDSIGPKQHLQMAQMRALEAGRWMIRTTNNGITATIDSNGQIIERLPAFEQAVLQTTVQPVTGQTPYLLWRSWPTLFLSFIGLIGGFLAKRYDNAPSH